MLTPVTMDTTIVSRLGTRFPVSCCPSSGNTIRHAPSRKAEPDAIAQSRKRSPTAGSIRPRRSSLRVRR